MLDGLKQWLVGWADSPAGPAMLALLTAAEAIIFPIPPDPLLIALALRNPSMALLLAGLTTVASVAGGVAGHWLGIRFGTPLLRRFPRRHVERVEVLFRRYGFWAVAIAALTPLPFKLFTISAGAFGIPRTPFVLASIAGRGFRFFLIGGLIFLWGDRFGRLLEERLELVTVAVGVMVVAAIVLAVLWERRSRRPSPPRAEDPGTG